MLYCWISFVLGCCIWWSVMLVGVSRGDSVLSHFNLALKLCKRNISIFDDISIDLKPSKSYWWISFISDCDTGLFVMLDNITQDGTWIWYIWCYIIGLDLAELLGWPWCIFFDLNNPRTRDVSRFKINTKKCQHHLYKSLLSKLYNI